MKQLERVLNQDTKEFPSAYSMKKDKLVIDWPEVVNIMVCLILFSFLTFKIGKNGK
jgi:hypothetical protein